MSAHSAGRRHRPALLVLVVAAAVVCLGLAWWQWDTYESGGGTAQNLGYALQWPAFGFAFLWAYRRFVVLESEPEEAHDAGNKAAGQIPEGILPQRPTVPSASTLVGDRLDDDPTLRDYNRYLAELNTADEAEHARRQPVPSTGTDISHREDRNP